MNERFRSTAEQAAWLGLSEKSVRKYAAAMGGVLVGNKLLFPESETLAWLETRSLRPRRRRGGDKGLRAV